MCSVLSISLRLYMQIPIGSEEIFAGIVDIVRMKAVVWNGEQLGASFEDQDIPADLLELAEEYRFGNYSNT